MVLYKGGGRKAEEMHAYIYCEKFSVLRGINRREVALGTEKGGRAEEKSSYRRWLPGGCCSPYKERCGRKEGEVSPFSLSGDFKTQR